LSIVIHIRSLLLADSFDFIKEMGTFPLGSLYLAIDSGNKL
jgi:hypothetical protein